MNTNRWILAWTLNTLSVGLASGSALVGPTAFAPTLGGGIAGDNYTLLSESTFGSVFGGGGQTGNSDLGFETSTFNWYEGNGTEHNFQTARGDIQDLHVTYDNNNLYVAVTGGTGTYNDWTDPGGNGDQTDLFVVFDFSGSTGGSLSSQDGFNGFDNDVNSFAKGVDFEGWAPQFALGLQFYDNGGGAGGYAELERLSDHANIASEGQATGNGGFEWDSFYDGLQAVSEFVIPWTDFGFSAGTFPLSLDLRMSAYTTHNGSGYDTFDSAYGVGQSTLYEQLGDVPGDVDSSGQLGASDGVAGTPNPGSNLVGTSGTVGQNDEIDTIGAWIEFETVPEPSGVLLLLCGSLALGLRRRDARG